MQGKELPAQKRQPRNQLQLSTSSRSGLHSPPSEELNYGHTTLQVEIPSKYNAVTAESRLNGEWIVDSNLLVVSYCPLCGKIAK